MPDSVPVPDTPAARKRALRARLRARRRDLDPATRATADHSINEHVLDLARSVPQGTVAAFRAFDGEPDLNPALSALARSGRRLALPVLVATPGAATTRARHLEFHAWDVETDLLTNHFGIDEPHTGRPVSLDEIGLILVPLVGWDPNGGRLGMGAGYYDRALAGVADQKYPVRAGIAYSVQRADTLPLETHDVRLHEIITEHGRFTCPP
ncbi:5-formyltetrahydrofolate cyclo-ligase [Elongatibacter sediminis]|uniref:5-formyltetrahydrofolate cyclo-ligase n=1 Tax=Elongatibacter sediminis TaxID=3119006 RepID=A0AAW9RLU1_9GAMM